MAPSLTSHEQNVCQGHWKWLSLPSLGEIRELRKNVNKIRAMNFDSLEALAGVTIWKAEGQIMARE